MVDILVIYDITDDRLRFKVAEILKNYGLYRIQKSAFYGDVAEAMLQQLKFDLKRIIRSDTLHIVKLCKKCYSSIELIGQAFLPVEEENVLV